MRSYLVPFALPLLLVGLGSGCHLHYGHRPSSCDLPTWPGGCRHRSDGSCCPADVPPPGPPAPAELAPLAPPLDPPLVIPPKSPPKPAPRMLDKLPPVGKVVTNGEPPLAGTKAPRPTIRIEPMTGFVP